MLFLHALNTHIKVYAKILYIILKCIFVQVKVKKKKKLRASLKKKQEQKNVRELLWFQLLFFFRLIFVLDFEKKVSATKLKVKNYAKRYLSRYD